MKSRYDLLLLAFCLAGCATAYKPSGYGGGYSETLLGPDVFRVHFDGNEHTTIERSRDFALLRASDLTLQHGYKYFSISDVSPRTAAASPPIPGQNVQVNNYVYGNTYNYHSGMQWDDNNGAASQNANAGMSNLANFLAAEQQLRQLAQTDFLVHCFATKPAGIETFDASFISKSIRDKYKIKAPAPLTTTPASVESQKNPMSGHYLGNGKSVSNGVELSYQIALDVYDSGAITFTCTGVVNGQPVVVTGKGSVDAKGNVTVQNDGGDTGHGTISGDKLQAGGENANGSIRSYFTAFKKG